MSTAEAGAPHSAVRRPPPPSGDDAARPGWIGPGAGGVGSVRGDPRGYWMTISVGWELTPLTVAVTQ